MRTRTVVILGAIGAAALGLGITAGLRGPGAARQEMEGGRLAFPGLAPRLQSAARIEIVRGGQTLAATRMGDRWVLPDRGSYPVQVDKLRGVLTGLTELRLLEPRTSDPEQYGRLGVGDPRAAAGTAILLRVLDGSGQPLTELVLGHRRVRTQGNVPEQIYVRFPTEAQAWLAEGRLAVDADVQLWLDRDVVDIPNAKIADVVVERGAERLHFVRQDGKPALESPAEHPPLEEYRVEDVFRALESVTFTDVQPDASTPGDLVGTGRFTTTDGQVIEVRASRSGDKLWVRLAATGPDAATLQARWAGWAFQLGQWKERAMAPSLQDLVAPPPAPAPGSSSPLPQAVDPGAVPAPGNPGPTPPVGGRTPR